jgi:hypothetical protein
MVIHDKESEILGILRGHSSAFWKAKTTLIFLHVQSQTIQPPHRVAVVLRIQTILRRITCYFST